MLIKEILAIPDPKVKLYDKYFKSHVGVKFVRRILIRHYSYPDSDPNEWAERFEINPYTT